MKNSSARAIAAGVGMAASLAMGVATAQTATGPALYLEGGPSWKRHTNTHTNTGAVGVRIPTSVSFLDGRLALSVDAYLSRWHTRASAEESDDFWQVGVVPMLRWRFDEGRSPWFIDAGIGVSYMTQRYRTRFREYGTRWNFSDHLGAGYTFGAQQQHEIGLYIKHVSNGGFEKPNPGQTFWLLRYAYRL